MNTLDNYTVSLKDLMNENTQCIKQEMRGKFHDQDIQIHKLYLEIRRLRLDMQNDRSELQLNIYRWILGFFFALVYIMLAILLLKK